MTALSGQVPGRSSHLKQRYACAASLLRIGEAWWCSVDILQEQCISKELQKELSRGGKACSSSDRLKSHNMCQSSLAAPHAWAALGTRHAQTSVRILGWALRHNHPRMMPPKVLGSKGDLRRSRKWLVHLRGTLGEFLVGAHWQTWTILDYPGLRSVTHDVLARRILATVQ